MAAGQRAGRRSPEIVSNQPVANGAGDGRLQDQPHSIASLIVLLLNLNAGFGVLEIRKDRLPVDLRRGRQEAADLKARPSLESFH